VSAATEVWDILPSRSTQSIFPVSNELKSCLAVRLWLSCWKPISLYIPGKKFSE